MNALCNAPCPDRSHTHTCARSTKHCGFHRDVKQKGEETCSWYPDSHLRQYGRAAGRS